MESGITLGSFARIHASGEIGEIIGIAKFIDGRAQCLMRYCNNSGVFCELWWDEYLLEKYELAE